MKISVKRMINWRGRRIIYYVCPEWAPNSSQVKELF
jgi:hypothetical protein